MKQMNTFKAPTRDERNSAAGANVPTEFLPFDDFEDIPNPGPSDWLANHNEPKQTFDDFVASQFPSPNPNRNYIYLQPVGSFEQGKSPPLEIIAKFVELFYCLPTKILPRIDPLQSKHFKTRINNGILQYKAGDITNYLRNHFPEDAFCSIAVSMTDLYPSETWNFVFGQASVADRVGVFSFARFDPAFYGNSRGPDYQNVLLKRSLKVVVHEIGHMFGISHCVWYNCLMRGSNHIQEADSKPMHFCPVCIRKVSHAVGFDVSTHYSNLRRFFVEMGFPKEAQWYTRRMKRVTH